MTKDKNGIQIDMLSKVECAISDGLFDTLDPTLINKTMVLAIVDGILPDGKVKCVPIEQGMPFIIDADRCEVVQPIIAALMECITDEDVQRIIDEAYTRLGTATVEVKKRAKKEGSTKSAAVKVNLADNLEMD